jgi:excisionase family DNA binding protein
MEPELLIRLDKIEQKLNQVLDSINSGNRFITPMYSMDDVARRLNMSKRTVKKLIDQGHIFGTRIGSAWRMKPENLERWLEKKQVTW